jgi:outer membrane lipopolysaccharide assembly protein LptE/RlpB
MKFNVSAIVSMLLSTRRAAAVVPAALVAAALVSVVSACGYHAAGHSDLLPKTIQTVCIPAFRNTSMKYKLSDRLPEALSMEFISRTRYHITTDCANADAVLNGSVNNYLYYPTVFDPTTGRASAVDMRLYLTVSLVERATKKVLFTRANMEVRERYEISVDPRAYFDESDAALARVAKTVAQQLVSAILENF